MRPAWTADVAALIASETPLRASHYVCGGERCSHRARANITTLGEDEPLSDDRGLPRHGGLEGLSERVHGAINIGRSEYEQVMIFFLDFPEAVAPPSEQNSA